MRYKRETLRELGCEGVEETFDRLDALWAYSTQQWLRHVVPQPTDRRNRSRWPSSGWWMVVRSTSFERPTTAPAQRGKAYTFHEERILATILGYLESWAAYRAGNTVPPDLDISTVLRAVADRSDALYRALGSDFFQEVLKKRRRLGYLH